MSSLGGLGGLGPVASALAACDGFTDVCVSSEVCDSKCRDHFNAILKLE